MSSFHTILLFSNGIPGLLVVNFTDVELTSGVYAMCWWIDIGAGDYKSNRNFLRIFQQKRIHENPWVLKLL